MSDKNIIVSVAVLLLAVGVVLYAISGGSPVTKSTVTVAPDSSPVAVFAQCLKDRGVIFYGAFWCPHCVNQKKLFGDAVALLPYVECSTPDGNGQLEICKTKKVDGYPTWEFADGSRLSGERTFAELGEKSGCPVPPSE
ncbi:MAG: hypothetical protein A3D65_02410 [Candidatus Lloydbacteria bacterium RIFCSPHIGHO2_02_FULL_50_13]|uniref:Thioredoxin domain-containing protein n=1 Tax=Candidatus Lloydbacteria bacterium RIFCSPHIGHO2_02_FULL_50_13 TaxID=1798661 RepID=A0A1G2D952_9BACT|nr:MAG: hypothetical protein A3D65_02410 [Candidatus Lloydbacteria bacterium RIFCSPHIGHO2_02_FULL_50_13]